MYIFYLISCQCIPVDFPHRAFRSHNCKCFWGQSITCVFFPFCVYECIPNCPSCFLILCSEHRRCDQSTDCPADTRPGSKRSSSGPCLTCFVSSQHMAGLRGTGWPSAHTRDICNGRIYFLNIHVIFRSNHAVVSTAGAAHRAAVPFVSRRRSQARVILRRQPDAPHHRLQ